MQNRVVVRAASLVVLTLLPLSVLAQADATFTDLSTDSPVLPAVRYLAEKGLIQSAPLFRPDDKVTRAQVAKILTVPLVDAEQLRLITASSFADVPAGEWFVPYVEAARALGIVDSAPTFNPNGSVTKAAFLKMLFKSKKLGFSEAFGDLASPLGSDAQNTGDWTFPVMRFALASSVTAVNKDGTLGTGQEITRGQMAVLYYRLEMYLQGRRTQALLSQAETDIGNVLQLLNVQDMSQAQWAAARSVLATRGALASRPNEPLVKGAVKVSEGFRSLVAGYKAGIAGDYDAAIAAAKEAYALAVKAHEFAPGLSPIVTQMQGIAKNMADDAREMKAQAAATVK